jgi:hypothetical protein
MSIVVVVVRRSHFDMVIAWFKINGNQSQFSQILESEVKPLTMTIFCLLGLFFLMESLGVLSSPSYTISEPLLSPWVPCLTSFFRNRGLIELGCPLYSKQNFPKPLNINTYTLGCKSLFAQKTIFIGGFPALFLCFIPSADVVTQNWDQSYLCEASQQFPH